LFSVIENELVDISDKNKKNILENIKNISDVDINKYISSEKSRKDFLLSIDKNFITKNKDLSDFFNIDESNILEKNKEDIIKIKNKIKNKINIDKDDLKIFFQAIYLNTQDKKRIVEMFFPYISLEDAIKW
jgi:hypothetical protein